MYGGDGVTFAPEESFSRAKITSLQFLRPKIHRISAETDGVVGGAESRGFYGFAKGETQNGVHPKFCVNSK